jgi:hypothetical protein
MPGKDLQRDSDGDMHEKINHPHGERDTYGVACAGGRTTSLALEVRDEKDRVQTDVA